MSFLSFIDHVMGTTPREPQQLSPDLSLREAHARIDRVQRDLNRLDQAVAVVEDRLRARGWVAPREEAGP